MLEDFGGFIDEGEICGGDLVEFLDYQFSCMPELKDLVLGEDRITAYLLPITEESN
jgi:hypothetical protein